MAQPEKLSLSVVVPVYNERDNLSSLTAQILKALTGQVGSFEIIYVDDGSTDGSGPLLEELAGYYLEVRVFHFDRNYGQTSAFDAGFHQAGGDLIATLDGDLQYDPADVPALARMHGFTVTEVPVRHYPRAHGRSKYGIGNRVFKALRDLLAVRWMQRRLLQYRYRDSTLHETVIR